MNFYNNTHPYYCGIDLHARSLYVCIIDQAGNTCKHKEITADPDKLQQLLEPYIGNIVVGVECMHCWYWVSDFCEDIGEEGEVFPFHSMYGQNCFALHIEHMHMG